MNRQRIVEDYVNAIVDGMDLDTLVAYAVATMTDKLNTYTDAELREEVEYHYPEILDEENT